MGDVNFVIPDKLDDLCGYTTAYFTVKHDFGPDEVKQHLNGESFWSDDEMIVSNAFSWLSQFLWKQDYKILL